MGEGGSGQGGCLRKCSGCRSGSGGHRGGSSATRGSGGRSRRSGGHRAPGTGFPTAGWANGAEGEADVDADVASAATCCWRRDFWSMMLAVTHGCRS